MVKKNGTAAASHNFPEIYTHKTFVARTRVCVYWEDGEKRYLRQKENAFACDINFFYNEESNHELGFDSNTYRRELIPCAN